MYNPSYLIKSRHDVYYFRYPLSIIGKSSRVSVSLKTRCPKQALRLTKILQYHATRILEHVDIQRMRHADIIRYVPIHPRLIELGFLEFVEEAKVQIAKLGKIKGKERRLLYHLTYTEHDKWGRNLGRFVNEKLLPELGLHAKNKKVLHSFRHSFITFLSTAGVDSAIIKSLAGHEANTVTDGVYTHYTIEHLKIYMDAIEKLEY